MTQIDPSDLPHPPSNSQGWQIGLILGGALLLVIGLGIVNAQRWAQDWREIEPEIRARIETVAHQGAVGVQVRRMPVGPTALHGSEMLVAQLDERFALVCSEREDRVPLLHAAPRGVPHGKPLPHRTDPDVTKTACARIRESL